jgi:hypothetical protein
MQTELRYQARINAKSNKPKKKKKSCKFSPIFYFFFIKNKNNKQYGKKKTSYAKARSNLCTLNDAIIEKQSFDLLFLSSPKIPTKFSQENTRGQT